MVCLPSSREGIIRSRLAMASCHPHGLEKQEERELTQDLGNAGSLVMVMGQEPSISEASLPPVQHEG